MIDIENEVFTKIKTVVKGLYPDINITSDPIASPSAFPCVSIFEADNYCHNESQDSGGNENCVNVMYEVYVFSNKSSGRKTECKNIYSIVDEAMIALGFTRISKIPILDSNIYRISGRYVAVVSKNKLIYRR